MTRLAAGVAVALVLLTGSCAPSSPPARSGAETFAHDDFKAGYAYSVPDDWLFREQPPGLLSAVNSEVCSAFA